MSTFTSPGSLSPGSSPSRADGSRTSYFTSMPNPRLDSIPENFHLQSEEPALRRRSAGSISFRGGQEFSPTWGGPKHRIGRIRTSSPPAPSRFRHHVSFDNFAGGEPTEKNTISFTLNVKHTGYQYKRRSRTFMVGLDENAYSNYALQWMLDELVDDGDEIVCLRVVDKDAKISSDKSMDKKLYQNEAKMLMQMIQGKNAEHRAISIVLEFAVGKLHDTFRSMIQLYQPALLIVGTRGRSLGGFQGLVNTRNSFSKWCLQYSPIPVVVVRPTEKRDKKKAKRANDPTRQSYIQILADSGNMGQHEANANSKGSVFEADLMSPIGADQEAHMVAAALGLPARFDPTLKPFYSSHPLSKVTSGKSDVSTSLGLRSESPSSLPTSPGLVQTSAKTVGLESPAVSDDEAEVYSEEEDEEGDFEVVPGEALLGKEVGAVEKQKKLHQMELGEAAALHGRKGSVASMDSRGSGDGDADDDVEAEADADDDER